MTDISGEAPGPLLRQIKQKKGDRNWTRYWAVRSSLSVSDSMCRYVSFQAGSWQGQSPWVLFHKNLKHVFNFSEIQAWSVVLCNIPFHDRIKTSTDCWTVQLALLDTWWNILLVSMCHSPKDHQETSSGQYQPLLTNGWALSDHVHAHPSPNWLYSHVTDSLLTCQSWAQKPCPW